MRGGRTWSGSICGGPGLRLWWKGLCAGASGWIGGSSEAAGEEG